MKSKKIKEILKIISEKLQGQNINWCIIGSTNLMLQGLKLYPHDIDLLTDKEGAYKIEKLFEKYSVNPVEWKENLGFGAYRGKLEIKGVIIDLLGEYKRKSLYPKLTGNTRTLISLDDIKLPCLKLEQEYEAYKKLKRPRKIELIGKKLKIIS